MGATGSAVAAEKMGHLQAELARLISATPHERLGVAAGADKGQVRGAFLQLVKEYHPHRFTRYGQDLERIANEIFLVIKEAYEQLLAAPVDGPATADNGAAGKTKLATTARRRRRTSAPAEPAPQRSRPNSVRFKPSATQKQPLIVDPHPPVRPLSTAAPQPARPSRKRGARRARPAASPASPPPGPAVNPVLAPALDDVGSFAEGSSSNNNDHTGLVARLESEEEARLAEYRAATALLRENKASEAFDAFKQLAIANPSEKRYRVYMHFSRGRVHQSTANYPAAEAEYRRALGIDARFAPALEALEAIPKVNAEGGGGGVFGRLFKRGR